MHLDIADGFLVGNTRTIKIVKSINRGNYEQTSFSIGNHNLPK